MKSEIGKRIKFAREYRNLTLKDLSKKCAEIDSNITYNGMWQWETGRRTPKYETVRTIAEVLDVMPTYFLEGENFNDPVEYMQPYLRLDEAMEKLNKDVIAETALVNKGLKTGYIKSDRLNRLTNDELDKIIVLMNKMLKKK